jgi:alpha-N-acetylglucosaminidase
LKEEAKDEVNIVGTSGVAAVWGFHHYLKYYCFSHVSWDSDQLSLPEELPSVNITITSADRSVAVFYVSRPAFRFLRVNTGILP